VSGTVKGRMNVGGIIGYEVGQNMNGLHFTGKVSGSENVGGLIGLKHSGLANAGAITRSFAKGSVSGTKNTGGLIGHVDSEFNMTVNKSYFAGKLNGSQNTGGIIGYAVLRSSYFGFGNSYVAGSIKGRVNTGGVVGAFEEDFLRYAALHSAYVSAGMSGNADSKGTLFGKRLLDFQTKIKDFYFDKSRAKTEQAGIEKYVGSPGSYAKPMAVSTGDISRKKLKGLNYKKIWQQTKPKGKKGFLPQLRAFSKSKNKAVKSASLSGVKTAAWYKVTYSGNGGRTKAGKKSTVQYVRYNMLKKTPPPAFEKKGYVATGISAQKPKKLPRALKNDKTKVKLTWKASASYVPADVYFAASRPSDMSAELKWNRVQNASGYYVYMSESIDRPYEKIAVIANPKASLWSKTGLEWNKAYYFKMTAYRNAYGSIFESSGSTAREVKILKPAAQSILAQNLPDGRVQITLNPGAYSGYEIRRSISQSGSYATIYDIPQSWFAGYSSSYVINSADIGRPYYYKAVGYRFASGGSGAKLYADDSNAVYAVARPAKAEVANIEYIATGSAVKLSIKNLFCTGYDVYRAQGSAENFTKVKTIELNGVGDSKQINEGGPYGNDFAVWSDTALSSGMSYYYKVIPFSSDYGIKAEGLPSDVRDISVP
jgi:hypothetical protein